jgi:hypothetical protein
MSAMTAGFKRMRSANDSVSQIGSEQQLSSTIRFVGKGRRVFAMSYTPRLTNAQ